ncbi:hypothetical protein QQZ08_004494 [Neonectria magnoliae]|uniref:Uncharacterized protein n=1 Tax=Neonectria magnoliae TaxID=2732573 RepID=A0ABR1I5Z6_9HYPO
MTCFASQVQWPPDEGSWYILRCEEHDFNFKDNPLAGAAAHVRGKKHGKKSSDYNTVLELLGIEVLGCDKSLAEKNNIAARDAFTNGQRQPAAETVTESIWASEEVPPANAQDMDASGSAGREKEEMNALCHVDKAINGNMTRLKQSSIRKGKTFSWKEGYEDDGPRVSMREFPVMFFDGSPFPSRSSVAWVSARDLKLYDASAQSLIEHSHQVLDYLESREREGRQKIASQDGTTDSAAADLESPGSA